MRRHNFRYQRDEIHVHLCVCREKFFLSILLSLSIPRLPSLRVQSTIAKSSDCGEHDIGTRRVAPGTSG
jgi:hypothetical protein